MSASFGIHFGASTACLAVCKDGKADVIANDTGDRTTPAIVSFTDHDRGVGLSAKQGMIRNSVNTVCKVKRILGRKFDDREVAALCNKGLAKITNNNGNPVFEVTYKESLSKFSPVQIASFVYKKMMDTAESHGGIADSHDAVITVPLDFTDQQKDAIQEAATKAGFRVLRIISEPAAAVLAYDIGQNSKDSSQNNRNVLVYRLGGTSMDVTVINICSGMYRIVASCSEKDFGGYMIDDLVLAHFASEFKKQWKCDCTENKRSVMKLRNASENCKHILSTMPTTQCSVESLFEGIDFQSTLSRGRFEALCKSFFQKCVEGLEKTLNSAAMTKSDIHFVVLCGGTTKIPALQKQIQDYFPSAELLSSITPDEVIATGASKQASLLSGFDLDAIQRNTQETSTPCLSADILVQVSEEQAAYVTVLQKYTPVPSKHQQNVQLGDEQTCFKLNLFSREEPSDEPKAIAKLSMDNLPAGCSISICFHVKGDGSLNVSCHEPSTDKSEQIFVEAS